MDRRGFLGAILAAGVAPAVVGYGNIMPVRMAAGTHLTMEEIIRTTLKAFGPQIVGPIVFANRVWWAKEGTSVLHSELILARDVYLR